jgi:hypothetical protein
VHGFNQRSVLKRLWRNKSAQGVVGTHDARLKLVGKIHLLGVRCERRGFRVFAVGKQDLHALLGLLQFDLPLARQLHAALEFVERLFQREIAALKTGNDLLQFTQRSFGIVN